MASFMARRRSNYLLTARRPAVWLAAALVTLLLICLNAAAATAQLRDAVLADYQVVNGHYFTQAGGDPEGDAGFRITDENGVNFASEFERLGGVEALGYPISRRFEWDGFTTQATQKGVLQWHPQTNRAALINLLDAFSDAGLDSWLELHAQVPPQQLFHDETELIFEEVVAARLAYLDDFPALRRSYLATPDYLERYGLPTAPIADRGSVRVLRTQRAVLQEWRVWTDSTRPGEVTALDVGTLAVEGRPHPGRGDGRAASEPDAGTATRQPAGARRRYAPGDAARGGRTRSQSGGEDYRRSDRHRLGGVVRPLRADLHQLSRGPVVGSEPATSRAGGRSDLSGSCAGWRRLDRHCRGEDRR